MTTHNTTQQNPENFSALTEKGFQITFINGVTISVCFDHGNYCANQYKTQRGHERGAINCENAEIAMWTTKDNKPHWITNEFLGLNRDSSTHDIEGWCTPADVARAIAWAEAYKGTEA